LEITSTQGSGEMPIPFFSENQIITSYVTIQHQLSLTKISDFSEKKGMGISPDPFRGGIYNFRVKGLQGQDCYHQLSRVTKAVG